jgi:hypothetical protein
MSRVLFQSARNLSLTPLVPGFGQVHPYLFSLENIASSDLVNVSVLAGHFSWEVWSSLPSRSKRIPSCFVMGRHPVDRVISYYYQRCYNEPNCQHYNVRLNDLSRHKLISFLESFRSALVVEDGTIRIVDEGVEEAACRAISNRKVTTGQRPEFVRLPPVLTTEEHEIALNNINHCIVGMQYDWEGTKEVLTHWFPWMNFQQEKSDKRMRLVKEKESISTIRSDHREIIELMNPCDMKLHNRMLEIFESELEVVRDDSYLIR